MPYEVPSLASLSARARTLFSQSITGAVVSIWPNTFTVVAKVLAAIGFEIHLRIAWLTRQMFASTADDEWLDRHGFELGLARIPAQRGVGAVTLTADAGVVIPAGVTYRRSDGAVFRSRNSAVGGIGIAVPFEAVAPGYASNADPATPLELVDNGGIPSLSAAAVVGANGIFGGSDREPKESFRARVLARKRNPPQGGSRTDWEAWTKEVDPAITRVFVDSFVNDTRQVWVSFLRNDRVNGIPNSGDVAAVQAYISNPVRRPITARVTAVAPVAVPVNVTIAGLKPDTVAARGAITAELASVFAEKSTPATPSQSSVFYREWIGEAISRASGETSHTLSAPTGNTTLSTSPQIAVLGTVTFT